VAQKNPSSRASLASGRLRVPRRSGGRLPPDYQVLVGIGGLLALLAVAVVVAVFLIVGLRNDTTHLTDRQVQYATAIDAAALNAKGMANDERGFLISGNPEFLTQFGDRRAAVRAAFEDAESLAAGDAQRRAVGVASAGFERWVEAVSREVATYESGDQEGAVTASLGPSRTLRRSYEASLATAQALGASAIESGKSSVSEASTRSVTILLAYLGLALAIGLAVTVWIVRTILQPVYALLKVLAAEGTS
jgi:methyl-accepting chemotaxis protein